MPVPAIWGPKLWAVLHAIGARAGIVCNKLLAADEARHCIWLLEHLEQIVPCPECRQHIVAYRKECMVPTDSKEIGLWIYTFHEAVNKRLGKAAGPPFTPELGRNTGLLESWKQYQESIRESVLKGSVVGHAVREWGRRYQLWISCS